MILGPFTPTEDAAIRNRGSKTLLQVSQVLDRSYHSVKKRNIKLQKPPSKCPRSPEATQRALDNWVRSAWPRPVAGLTWAAVMAGRRFDVSASW